MHSTISWNTEEDYSDTDEKYRDDTKEVIWEEEDDDEDGIATTDDIQMVAARVLPGQDSQYSFEAPGGGLFSTTAEGALGKAIKRAAMMTKTDIERFRDKMLSIVNDAGMLETKRSDLNLLINIMSKVPDVKYRSPAGVFFGYLAMNLIGKSLSKSQEKELERIYELSRKAKLSDFDVIRYARYMRTLFNRPL